MSTITTKDGTEIFYKDWGPKNAQPIVFHHGWPLSADDWDTQMLYLPRQGLSRRRPRPARPRPLEPGERRSRHGPLRRRRRRGGRASRPAKRRPHRPLHRRRRSDPLCRPPRQRGRVAKLVLIGAVPPIMVKTPANPGGLPIEVFDGLRKTARRQPCAVLPRSSRPAPSTASTGQARSPSQGVIQNWWRQGMMGSAKAHYDGIKAFSETDFTEDLKIIDVPTLVMHGDDDQIVPIADSALLSAKLLKNGTLKVYESFPHGMCTTHADVVNPDLLAFIAA